MRVAQTLYEEGAITYMRTDGVQMDGERDLAPRARAITDRYDAGFVPDKPRHYQTKAKNAQEAHEAIRPTDFDRARAGSGDDARLYELVFKRALASQMASARLERTTVELTDGTGQHELRATGQVVLFPGFLALYEEGRDRESRMTTRKRACCRRCARATRRRRRTSSRRSISRSRRRAIPKPVSSSGWRSSASAGRRPMPRRCRC